MATSQTEGDKFQCVICFGGLQKPRKLPGCLHEFCENCILTYILSLKSNNELKNGVPCPVCRNRINIPTAVDELQNWVSSLELNHTMASQDSEEVDGSVCSPCQEKQKTNTATKYCVDYNESLCSSCSETIHSVKRFQTHSVLEFNKNNKNESERKVMRNLSKYRMCCRHPDRAISCICVEENALCCIKCVISDHGHCSNVVELEDHVSQQRNDTEMKNVKEKINAILSQTKTLTERKRTNWLQNKEKAAKLISDAEEIRTKVNTIFDVMLDNLRTNTNALIKEDTLTFEKDEEKLQGISQSLTAFETLMDTSLKMRSSSDIYIILFKLNRIIKDSEKGVFEMGQTYKQTDMELHVADILSKLMEIGPNDTSELLDVERMIPEVTVLGTGGKKKLVNSRFEKIAEHRILRKGSSLSAPEYYSSLFLSKGGLLLTDAYHGVCCLTDQEYKSVTSLYMAKDVGKPYCSTCVKNGIIAVTIPEEKKICFIRENVTLGQLQICGQISTKFTPKAVHGLKNGDIVVSWNGPVAFGILTFTCSLYFNSFKDKVYFQQDAAGRVLKTFEHMAVDENMSHVLQSCTIDKAVYCFDFHGNPKFVYTNPDLHSPHGVTFDIYGNFFVCDVTNSTIHVVSFDGEGLRVVTEGCPNKPISVACSADGSQAVVTHKSEPWIDVSFFRLSNEENCTESD